MKQTLATLLFIIFLHGVVQAELKYQQDMTFTSFHSKEDVENRVKAFCEAAKGDADIKVIGIKYDQKKGKQVCYDAIVTCHVSQLDKDLMRIVAKTYMQRYSQPQKE